MPVPGEVSYIEASATGQSDEITFSVDGGQTYASRTTLTVGSGDQERLATADEITHIKWNFADPIAPSGIGTISFSAVLK